MNINRVYVAIIYIVTKKEHFGEYLTLSSGYSYSGRGVKKALVYRDKNGSYIDLDTKERYSAGTSIYTKVGDLIIDPSNGLIPVASVIGFDRINMSKRKILKKYNEVMEVEKDEESI